MTCRPAKKEFSVDEGVGHNFPNVWQISRNMSIDEQHMDLEKFFNEFVLDQTFHNSCEISVKMFDEINFTMHDEIAEDIAFEQLIADTAKFTLRHVVPWQHSSMED